MNDHNRFDGLVGSIKDHYMRVIRRVDKYVRRLKKLGYIFIENEELYTRGHRIVTIDYIEESCDFTDDEFEDLYGIKVHNSNIGEVF